MFYRKVSALNFIQLTGVFNATTSKYDFAVEETFFDDMGMEYYMEVKDPSQNKTRSPVTGNHLTRLKYSDANVSIGITAGTTLSGYQIITVPFVEMASDQIGNLFEEFGAPDATKWRMLRYRHNPQAWEEYPSPLTTVERGVGYFVISKEGVTLKLGTVSAPTNTQSNLFQLSLKQGWNLIGNPYTSTINWSDSKITGVGDLKVFTGGAYTTGNELKIFQGGFVFADAPITVPVKLKTSATGGRIRGSDYSADIGNSNWIVPIRLEQKERHFMLGGIGMSETARSTYDDLDDLAPPSLDGNLEIRFDHPEHFMKYFARDVVQTQDEYQWNFKVESDQQGLADIKWDRDAFGSNSKELYLMDVTRQVVLDMRASAHYTFDPKYSKKFRMYFGENLLEKVKPESVYLGRPFPNPTTGNSTIGFTLPESKAPYHVQLELFNSMGQRLAVPINGEMKPGFYTHVWDMENYNGLYFYRLTVNENGALKILTEKIIVNK